MDFDCVDLTSCIIFFPRYLESNGIEHQYILSLSDLWHYTQVDDTSAITMKSIYSLVSDHFFRKFFIHKCSLLGFVAAIYLASVVDRANFDLDYHDTMLPAKVKYIFRSTFSIINNSSHIKVCIYFQYMFIIPNM